MNNLLKSILLCLLTTSFISFAQFENPKAFEGTFAGAWNNTTFSSNGAANLVIVVNETLMTITTTLDLDGNVFGGVDPPPMVMNGPFTGNGFNVNGNSPQIGDLQLIGDDQGNINGSFTNIPGGFIDREDFAGTYDHLNIDMNFVIYFTGGGGAPGAVGTINMVKQNPVNDPANLLTNVVGTTSVNLNWTDNSGNELGFRIDRRIATTGTWGEIGVVNANTTTYSDNAVAEGTDYEYRIAGYNNDTESEYSNVASASVGFAPINDPTTLNATSAVPGEVDLVWQDNAGNETGYKVERGITTLAGIKVNLPQTDFAEIASLPANSTGYTDNSATQGVAYTYRVKAFNANTESGYSNEANVTVAVEPIATPTQLMAASNDPGAVDLTWTDASTNEDGFTVERKDAQNDWSVVTTTVANVNNYQDTGLEEGISFTYRVRAFNAFTVSDYSNEASALTLPTPVESPTNLVASSNQPGSVDLVWEDNAGNEDGYIVERDIVTSPLNKLNQINADYSVLTTLPANTTAYTDNAADEGVTYTYRVKAFNSLVESDYSNEASATSLITPVITPTNLTASSTAGSVNLLWQDNADNETGYILERKNSQSEFTQLASLPADSEGYTDNEVNQGDSYTYRVKAFNLNTESEYSNETSVTVGIIPVSDPANLTAISSQPGVVELNWEDNADNEEGYKVERDIVSPASLKSSIIQVDYSEIASLPANSTSYTDNDAEEGVTYIYRVKAFNLLTESGYSNEASVTAMITPINAPSDLIAVSTNEGIADLSWTDNSDNEDGFKIERRDSQNDWTEIASVPNNSSTYSDNNVTVGEVYTYRVKAFNSLTESDYSNEASVTIITSVLHESVVPEEFALSQNYPNPFNPSTIIKYQIPNLDLKQMVMTKLLVYDNLGRIVAVLVDKSQQPGFYEIQFNSASFGGRIPSGIYYYQLKADNYSETKKMILIK